MSSPAQVLIAGKWQDASTVDTFQVINPATGETLPTVYPVSDWSDREAVLASAAEAYDAMQSMPGEKVAAFLNAYADLLDGDADAISEAASVETGYPVEGRLKGVELPRTTNQLRLAAKAALDTSWQLPEIDAEAGICSLLEAIGPVLVIGPNNFPLAFNAISGGDFAAAIASGCPVVAIGHSSHPTVCHIMAGHAAKAAADTGMPAGTVQMLHRVKRDSGLKMLQDPRIASVGFTGSRSAGMALKKAADELGKPAFLEMSSVNPVVMLPGVIAEKGDDLAEELTGSALLGTGQFCTNPGIVFVVKGEATDKLITSMAEKYDAAPCGTLLGEGTQQGLSEGIDTLIKAGAELVTGNKPADRDGCAWANTLMKVTAEKFLADPEQLQTEAFGNATLMVIADSTEQLPELIACCEGNLTGCIYSAADGSDDPAYDAVAPIIRRKVGRLLNDKMPTGVAVSPAMNHGGPFPATGHPHFTAVGLPAAMRRFTRLACYDNIRPHRLPKVLQEMMASS